MSRDCFFDVDRFRDAERPLELERAARFPPDFREADRLLAGERPGVFAFPESFCEGDRFLAGVILHLGGFLWTHILEPINTKSHKITFTSD